jgi:hypothetical protein
MVLGILGLTSYIDKLVGDHLLLRDFGPYVIIAMICVL